MKSFKKLANTELSKHYISIFMMIFLMNNLIAFGSENKSYSFQNNQNDVELEKIYKLNKRDEVLNNFVKEAINKLETKKHYSSKKTLPPFVD